MGDAVELNDTNFDNFVTKNKVVVVDFWAPWCEPCKMMGPVFEEVATDYKGKAVFGKLLVDDNQGTAKKYIVMSIPTLLIFKNGEVKERLVGFTSKDVLAAKIEEQFKE